MPKMKTHSGAKKRFKPAGSRKNPRLKRAQKNKRHILTKKAPKRKRQLRGITAVVKANKKAVKGMLA